ncbi:hypothetical protein [Lacihabitans sp. LS3-19]|nr:hypothetical protein [Lacihabitans sp. LS3-19]
MCEEIDTNLPQIISGAGVNSKGKSTKSIVELVDIFSSLCD